MIARKRKEAGISKESINKVPKDSSLKMCSKKETKSSSNETKSKPFSNEIESKSPSNKTESSKSPEFNEEFGFHLQDIKSWNNFVSFMYRPMDPASLGAIRIMFGFMMILDIPEERGLADADINWGDPTECRFPLFNFLQPLSLQWMCMVYLVMWLGALGIMLGFYYRTSCLVYTVLYWYIFLLDKTAWNNHSYLYGVISILLIGSQAHHFWSLDIQLGRVKRNCPVPLWNYFILRFQIFILYFYAGLKKMDRDWLEGYSMKYLSNHWVFDPFTLFLTTDQVDYWIIHVTGFTLDLTIGFFLIIKQTRPYGLLVLSMFHIMNSRLFSIGMFPYVCLVTMPIFCNADWPRKLPILRMFSGRNSITKNDNKTKCLSEEQKVETKSIKAHESLSREEFGWKHNLVMFLLISHMGLQAFLPYSHFITKGYNNWTPGLYGYSWDMMVHTWNTVLVVVKVLDNETGKEYFMDPEVDKVDSQDEETYKLSLISTEEYIAWVQSARWEKHGDMLIQYAHCLKEKLLTGVGKDGETMHQYQLSNNISVYIDVWCSLNGRFQQRMFDPTVDLLTVDWSPFREVSFLMPLLTEFSDWRTKIFEKRNEVYSWSNYSDVMFVADFPGLTLENYINEDLANVTLTVLEGEVLVEIEIKEKVNANKQKITEIYRTRIKKNESMKIPEKRFHKVITLSETPSCYMYSYINQTKQMEEEAMDLDLDSIPEEDEIEEILSSFKRVLDNWARSICLVSNALLNVLYSIPMIKRIRVA